MKRSFLMFFLAAFAVTVLLAADFWTTTEFAQWSDKDVKKMLTNSPWAKTQDVAIGGRMPGGGGDGGGGRGGGSGGGGGGMPGGGMSGGGEEGGGGGGQGMAMPSIRVYLRWISALPVRQAIARSRFGNELNSPEAQQYLTAQDERYVLVVAGLPVNMAGGGRGGGRGGGEPGERPDPAEMMKRITDGLTASAKLKVKGKEPVQPSEVQLSGTREEPEIYMAFPKAKDGGFDIALEDKDVEFELKMRSGNTLRRKFRLADMVYNGKLEI